LDSSGKNVIIASCGFSVVARVIRIIQRFRTRRSALWNKVACV